MHPKILNRASEVLAAKTDKGRSGYWRQLGDSFCEHAVNIEDIESLIYAMSEKMLLVANQRNEFRHRLIKNLCKRKKRKNRR